GRLQPGPSPQSARGQGAAEGVHVRAQGPLSPGRADAVPHHGARRSRPGRGGIDRALRAWAADDAGEQAGAGAAGRGGRRLRPDGDAGMVTERSIGQICNHYGGLSAKAEDGKFYWTIEGYGGEWWEEIPESLYHELIKHADTFP